MRKRQVLFFPRTFRVSYSKDLEKSVSEGDAVIVIYNRKSDRKQFFEVFSKGKNRDIKIITNLVNVLMTSPHSLKY